MGTGTTASTRRSRRADSYNVRALERGLDILFCFEGDQAELGVTEVSQRLGLNKATVSRLMSTLAAKGLLAENPVARKYHLTYRLHALVSSQLDRLDLRSVARPHMRRLRDEIDETVGLYVPVGLERTCIEQVESTQEVRRTAVIGRTRTLLSGATGRVLLAWRSETELQRLIRASASPDSPVFVDELQSVRQHGYALAVDQTTPGVSGIAAPIHDIDGEVVAALAVTGPSARWTRERMVSFATTIIEVADAISQELGYRPVVPGTASVAKSGARRWINAGA